MSVLIAGCGDLGTEIGLRFAASGYDVVGLRRRPTLLPTPIEGRGVDLSEEVPDVPFDTEIVVIATAADRRDQDAYRSAYVDGLTNLLRGLSRSDARPRRILLVSSTAVYGDNKGDRVDETTPASPGAPSAAIIWEAEQLLHREVSGAIVVRLAGLYGPGRTRLIDQVRSGSAARDGEAPAYTNRIHRDDAAAAIVHLATGCDSPDRLYIGSDHEPAPRFEVVQFLSGVLGVEPPAADAYSGPIRAGRRCSNDRLLATGFAFTYPTYREGYRAIVEGQGVRHP